VPVVVASPWSAGDPKNPRISSLVFDHTSVLKLIEWRWGLAPLTPRDASNDVNNLAYALDFSQPQTAVPSLSKPHTPLFVLPCFQDLFGGRSGSESPRAGGAAPEARPVSSSAGETAAWSGLRAMAKSNGFAVE
jgi:phospholipase C